MINLPEYGKSPWAIINSAAAKEKNQQVVMKKTRFGKNEKTIKCGICGASGSRLKFGKQTVIRCNEHIKQLNAKNDVHVPVFKKASQL